MPKQANRNPFNTTMEIPNTLRDDITALAKHEAALLDLPKLTNKDYLTRLVAREKASVGL